MPSEIHYVVAFLTVLVTLQDVFCVRKNLLPPPENQTLFMEQPVCTSQNTLCHLSFNISIIANGAMKRQNIKQTNEFCRCPNGVRCPVEWNDTDRSIVKHFKGESHSIFMKMNFCQLDLPSRICEKDELAVTLKGIGFIMTDVHAPFRCKCRRVLYENRSWSDDRYDYIEYSCGKPRCHIIKNHVDNDIIPCMRITNATRPDSLEPTYRHQYYCRCRFNETCKFNDLPTQFGESTLAYCKPKSKRRPKPRDYFRNAQSMPAV